MMNIGDLLLVCPDTDSRLTEIEASSGKSRVWTTSQLEQYAQSVAGYLKHLGHGPGDRIAMIANNCLEFVACYLGICKLGSTAVMINPGLPASQITHLIAHSGSCLILSDQVQNYDCACLTFDVIWSNMSTNIEFESYQPGPQDIAVILHTSGSTGLAKRVLISHNNRARILRSEKVTGLNKLFANPFCHSMGMNCLDLSLVSKHNLFFLSKFRPDTYLKAIDQFKITHLIGVPSMFGMLMSQPNLAKDYELDSVEHLLMSGGPVNESLLKQLTLAFKNTRINIGYGSTELGPGIFGAHPTLPTPHMSVGCQVPGIDYRLVDGVLHVRTPASMKGYDQSTDSFTEDGYFVTNDRFVQDENGFYYFAGRNDDMFKSGDHKIYPMEIETVLEQHPSVDKSVVVPVPDSVKFFKPYAFVTVRPGMQLSVADLQEFVDDKLARYQIPRQIWVIDTMPLNSVNKIDRWLLKNLAEQKLAT